MSDPSPPSPQQAGSSPLPGCIILSVIVLVFGGLVVLYTATGLWMNKQIDQFTDPEPAEIPIAEATEDQARAVQDKLDELLDASLGGRMERFTLTTEELNTLLASQPIMEDFIGQAYVEGISEEGIRTQVTQQMRSLKPGEFRYLNATIHFVPVLLRNTIVFEISQVEVPGREVPEKFIESFSSQHLFKIDPSNPELEPVLKTLEKVYLENDQVVLETGRPEAPEPNS